MDRPYEIKKGDSSSYEKVLLQIQNFEFEWVLCPHESWTSAWFQKGIKAQHKISFSQWWNFLFFTDRISMPSYLPAALRQMSLLGLVDKELDSLIEGYTGVIEDTKGLIQVPKWSSMSLDLDVLSEEFKKVQNKFDLQAQCIAIFPGSTWETKKWMEQGFVESAHYFESQGFQVLFLGTQGEKDLCERLSQQTQSRKNLAGQSALFETLAILASAKLVICNDSGGQHLASLVAAPTLSIFGPTVLSQGFRPWNKKSLVAEVDGLKCRPCGRHGHKKCPLGTHDCMKLLKSSQVIEKAKQLLSLNSPSH